MSRTLWLVWLWALSAFAVSAQDPGAKGTGSQGTVVIQVRGQLGSRELVGLAAALNDASRGVTKRVVLDIDTAAQVGWPEQELEMVLAALRDGSAKPVAWVRKEALGIGGLLALACQGGYYASSARIGAFVAPSTDAATAGKATQIALRIARSKNGPPSLAIAAGAMADAQREVFDVSYSDRSGIEATAIVDAQGITALEQRGAKIGRKRAFPDRPLIVSVPEADRLGIVKGIFASLEDLVREEFNEKPDTITSVDANAAGEGAGLWLHRMKPILFVLGFLLLIIELKTPGFAVAGTLGLLLLGLAMYASWYMGLATWAEILLFFAGIGLIAVEVFVAPGTIVFAGLGLTMTVIGLVLSQQPFLLPRDDAESALLRGNLTDIVLLILSVAAGTALFWRILPKLPWIRGAMLVPPTPGSEAGAHVPVVTPAEAALVGKETVTTSDLRPAGFVEIDGKRLDVTSEGPFVPIGTRVRILAVTPTKIVVTPCDDKAQRGEVSIGFLVFLVLLGTTMLIAEVFLVSFGVLFVGAAVAMLMAVVLAFTHHGSAVGWTFLIADAIVGPTAFLLALKTLPKTRFGKNMILSGSDPAEVKNAATDETLGALLGKRGVALTDLRPSGYARIEGRRIDVVARGLPLAKDSAVLVVAVEQNRVVVAQDAAPTQRST